MLKTTLGNNYVTAMAATGELRDMQAVLLEIHICIARLCHQFLVLISVLIQRLHKLY